LKQRIAHLSLFADHLKTAEKLESEKLAKINFNSTRIVDLDALLCDTYDRDCPKPVHYQNRRDLIRIFNMMAKEIYGNLFLFPKKSSLQNLLSKESKKLVTYFLRDWI
jgi:hypothetical protein